MCVCANNFERPLKAKQKAKTVAVATDFNVFWLSKCIRKTLLKNTTKNHKLENEVSFTKTQSTAREGIMKDNIKKHDQVLICCKRMKYLFKYIEIHT